MTTASNRIPGRGESGKGPGDHAPAGARIYSPKPTPAYSVKTLPPLAIDESTRTIRYIWSDGSVDRAGDTIDPDGWVLGPYSKNPQILWAHDSGSPPIARGVDFGVGARGLAGGIQFAPADVYPFADTIYRLAKNGFIRAVSVGFIALDWSLSNDKNRPHGIDFHRQELIEVSVVPVPANANALEARCKALGMAPPRVGGRTAAYADTLESRRTRAAKLRRELGLDQARYLDTPAGRLARVAELRRKLGLPETAPVPEVDARTLQIAGAEFRARLHRW